MPNLSYLGQQRLINDFCELSEDYELGVPVDISRILEKLLALEKLPFFAEVGGSYEFPVKLKTGLVCLLKRLPANETALIARSADLLVKLLEPAFVSLEDKGILCEIWWYSRTSYLENLLRVHQWIFPFDVQNNGHLYYGFYAALKIGQWAWLEKFVAELEQINFPDTTGFLVNSLLDKDAEISHAARQLFQRLPRARTRQILEASLLSPANLKASIRLALLDESFFDTLPEQAGVIQVLVDLLTESDFATNAEAILRNLRTKAGQARLCHLFLFKGNHLAQTLAVAAGYEPQEPAHKALFLFLIGQLARYDSFDFDHRKLRGLYEVAGTALRQRVAETVRKSGNPAYLDILSLKQASPAAEILPSQLEVIVQVLADRANWATLWQKVFELPFAGSLLALHELLKSDWQPSVAADNALYQSLVSLGRSELADTAQLKTVLPAKARKLLIKPFSGATALEWASIKRLVENSSNFTVPTQNALAYISAVVGWRFSDAIEIEAVSGVEPTKTDIEF